MKFPKLFSVALLALGALALATAGCAHGREHSQTKHELSAYAVVAPPGDTVTTFNVTNTAAGNELVQVNVTSPGTSPAGFWAGLTAPGPKVYRVFHEVWEDTSSGGGTFLLTDPQASALTFNHTNQSALGGSRASSIGEIQSTISTNAVQAIGAGGTAVGNVIKAATGKP